eukprot:9233171-Pyramimonas_sp.AAC.2
MTCHASNRSTFSITRAIGPNADGAVAASRRVHRPEWPFHMRAPAKPGREQAHVIPDPDTRTALP